MKRTRRTGFTLIELLVVIAIIALLIAILLPSLSAAKQEGMRTKCLANLRSISQASQAYATDDPSGKYIPEHSLSQSYVNEGYFEYGGNDGMPIAGNQWAADGPFGGGFRRPLNKFMGLEMVDNSGTQNRGDGKVMALYQCPSDIGLVDTPGYTPEPEEMDFSSFDHKGTSYMANCMRAVDGNIYYSMSPYLRPVSRIPATSDTIAYMEELVWEAIWNSNTSFGVNSNGVTITGWHRKAGQFNTAFCDGSARTVSMRPNDWLEPPPYDNLMVRGTGRYQMDTEPEVLVREGRGS